MRGEGREKRMTRGERDGRGMWGRLVGGRKRGEEGRREKGEMKGTIKKGGWGGGRRGSRGSRGGGTAE